MRNNIPIIFKCFISRENKYFRYPKKAAARLWQTPAYRDHHGRQAEFSFPSSLLSSHLFSRFLHMVFLSISALILFFFFRPEHLSLFFSTAPHVEPAHVLAREIHSPFSGRCSFSLRPLPYLFSCPPHPVSVSGSSSGVSINLAITPRWISENGHVRRRGNGTRLRLYRCIHRRAYIVGAHACMFEGRIGRCKHGRPSAIRSGYE